MWSIMSKWMQAESSPSTVRVLDMAAGRFVPSPLAPAHGSGEVTEALLEWEKAHRQSKPAMVCTPANSRAFIPPNARRSAATTALRLPHDFSLEVVATDPVCLPLLCDGCLLSSSTPAQPIPLARNGNVVPSHLRISPTESYRWASPSSTPCGKL